MLLFIHEKQELQNIKMRIEMTLFASHPSSKALRPIRRSLMSEKSNSFSSLAFSLPLRVILISSYPSKGILRAAVAPVPRHYSRNLPK